MKNTIRSIKRSPLFNPPYAFNPYCGNSKYAVSYLNATTFQVPKGPLTLMSDLRTGISKKSRIVDLFVGYNWIEELEA
jgi:hypothetical protein